MSEASSRPAAADFRPALIRGSSTGLVLLLAALVGMFEQFAERPILAPVLGREDPITLDWVLLLGGLAIVGFVVARSQASARDSDGPPEILAGIAGASAGLILALYVQLAARVDLRDILINAKPLLVDFLSFGAGASAMGLIWPILAGIVMALLGAALARLPDRLRSGLIWGIAAVALLGTLQSVLTRQVDLVTRSRKADGLIAAIVDWLYASKGVAVVGALTVIGLLVLLSYLGPMISAWVEAARQDDDSSGEAGGEGGRSEGRPYRIVRAWDQYRMPVGIALGLLLLLWLPLGLGTYPSDVLDTVGIFLLMGLGLNIVVGFAGLLDLGYVAFYAIGAYTLAVLTSPKVGIEWGFWEALPVAVLASILSGVLLGVPVLKSHGDYLAIITLGFGEIIRVLAISDALKPWIGGARGIQLIPKALELPRREWPLAGTFDPQVQQEIYYPILLACGLALYVAWRLQHSRHGRAWMAVREDEEVAEAMGINLVRSKLLAFATGAAMAGLGGALFASKVQTIFPASFNLLISINVLVLIIVGGMGSIPGVFVGALALVALPELLREFSDFRLLLYGMVLVIMMLNRPEGLWPASIRRRELHRHESQGEATA